MIGGQQGWAQTQGKKQKKSFSPKMLVYENLKNENVLRHFNQRFAQLDTLINNHQSSNWDSTNNILLTLKPLTHYTGLKLHTNSWLSTDITDWK